MFTNYYDKLCDKLINLRQRNMLLIEYMQKFDELKTMSQTVKTLVKLLQDSKLD